MTLSLWLFPCLLCSVSALWFDQHGFSQSLNKAMRKVTQLLDNQKFPQLAETVDHEYEDKYELAEFLVKSGSIATSNALLELGLKFEDLKTIVSWAEKKSVTLKFQSEQTCAYSHSKTYDEESSVKKVEKKTKKSRWTSAEETVTQTIVNTITDHYWAFKQTHKIVVCRGVGSRNEDCIELSHNSNSMELKTKSETASPRTLGLVVLPPREVDVTPLLQTLLLRDGEVIDSSFTIDRNASSCKTPSRNAEVDAIMRQYTDLHQWAEGVSDYFLYDQLPLSTQQNAKANALTAANIFNPVIPLFVDCSDIDTDQKNDEVPSICVSSGSVTMSDATMKTLLGEQVRTLQQVKHDVAEMFDCASIMAAVSGNSGEGRSSWCNVAISPDTAAMIVSLLHLRELSYRVHSSILYVEDMLRKQLSTAIGKEVTSDDLTAYMTYHNQKLFKRDYHPQQMTHAVRRSSAHSPEGRISIEGGASLGSRAAGGKALEAPVYVVSKSVRFGDSVSNSSSGDGAVAVVDESVGPVSMAIDASTEVTLAGERYVHAHLQHIFSSKAQPDSHIPLYLTAQARQFSSFIVLIGRVPSATSFDPLFGVIVKNKDELRIPLDVAVIPSAEEFRDAIASLSPEQQQFAKAFRKLQLQSTLFGICVVQIKPQMEKVLNLPPDSLTKEIELTEHLMEMFIKYQIPPDMLSFEGDMEPPTGDGGRGLSSKAAALSEVKANVAAIQDMIGRAKEKEINEKEQVDAMNRPPPSRFTQPSGVPTHTATNVNFMTGSASVTAAASMESDYGDVSLSSGDSAAGSVRLRGRGRPQVRELSGEPSGQPSSAPTVISTAHSNFQPGSRSTGNRASEADTSSESQSASTRTISSGSSAGGGGLDVTALPSLLANRFEEFGHDSVIRPAIITAGSLWQMKSQAKLLGGSTTRALDAENQRSEKLQAFGLLDALTKSGAVSIHDSTLHVVISSAHIFDRSVIDTIIQDNIDPIEKLEQSTLIMASTVHEIPASELVEDGQLQRLAQVSPGILGAGSADGALTTDEK